MEHITHLSQCTAECQLKASNTLMETHMPVKLEFFEKLKEVEMQDARSRVRQGFTTCVNGLAGEYPCNGMDLVNFLPHSELGTSFGNDIWGWTDPSDNKEYILAGSSTQTTIVEILDGGELLPIAKLSHAESNWSDIKVYSNHMYVGTEEKSGIQVYDLTQLRTIDRDGPVVDLSPDSVYMQNLQSHNVVINEDSGYMYVVGSQNSCGGGLHMVDITTPSTPVFAGCYSQDGYTHDAQCVIYVGPDTRYSNREICFNFNEDTLTIVDVNDKSNPALISRTGYSGSFYTHQGWCTEDHQYLLLNDELDERFAFDRRTHTYLWDIRDLENPRHFSDYYAQGDAIDHNLYVKGDLVFESNYEAGLRVLDISDIANGNLEEVAFFDVRPESDNCVEFKGTWSSYIYFESGYKAVNSIERGLFLVEMNPSSRVVPSPPARRLSDIDPRCLLDKLDSLGSTDSITTFSCFSPHATTMVEGKGVVPMKDIVVGDKVLSGSGEYKTVYTIDHYHKTKRTKYLQIYADGENLIELTPKHMVFVEGKRNPIPSGQIKVGDLVQTISGPKKVMDIAVIFRDGLYNPLTADGTIIVGGIMASTYSSYDANTAHVEIGGFKLHSLHAFLDMAAVPYRTFCMGVSMSACSQHDELALVSKFMVWGYNTWSQQGAIGQILMYLIFVSSVGLINFIMSPFGIIILCGLLLSHAYWQNMNGVVKREIV